MKTGITLETAELVELVGYTQPAKQLAALKKQGFWRARRGATGRVILERAHFEAVCRGDDKPAPELRAPTLRG